MLSIFLNKEINKPAGPDNIKVKLFKACHLKLYLVFRALFQIRVELGEVLLVSKTSVTVPIPTKLIPILLNDYINTYRSHSTAYEIVRENSAEI